MYFYLILLRIKETKIICVSYTHSFHQNTPSSNPGLTFCLLMNFLLFTLLGDLSSTSTLPLGFTETGDICLCSILVISDCEGGDLCLYKPGVVLELRSGDVILFKSDQLTHFNLHFKGFRSSMVFHTDRAAGAWVS